MFVEHKEAMEATEANTLKFSWAIREGARRRPQGFGSYNRNGKTCAVGAAAEALGTNFSAACAALNGRFLAVHDAIVHRNDYLRWTREQIADWLEAQGL